MTSKRDADRNECAPSFLDMYHEGFTYVWNCLRRFGVNGDDLEDASQEVFLTLHRRIDSYDPARPLKPFLAGISFRVASNFRRTLRRRPPHVNDTVSIADPLSSPKEDRLNAQQLLHMAMEELDLDRRAVFVLHDIEGYSVPEISEILAVPDNTLYTRLHRARKQLVAAVERHRHERGVA